MNKRMCNRRHFVTSGAMSLATLAIMPSMLTKNMFPSPEGNGLKISLAQWSFHRALRSGSMDHLDFARRAADEFGINAVEYVNQFFPDKATDHRYLREMNMRADDLGVRQLLIMIDGEGGLAEPSDVLRKKAVDNHYKWVDAAKMLGCHSIRVNAFGSSMDRAALHGAAVMSLSTLADYAGPMNINVIVENHGGPSSDGKWLSAVMKDVDRSNCGTLPDFGNFCVRRDGVDPWNGNCVEEYDRYTGVEEMLPFAYAVSAKSYDFDEHGQETTIDYVRMIDLVKKSSYQGHLGIEYEGDRLSETDGIRATKALLDKLI